jgi:cytochrome c peroxidase
MAMPEPGQQFPRWPSDTRSVSDRMTWARVAILVCAALVMGTGAAADSNEPVTPIHPVERLDAEKVELGRKLFHDVRLSHDDTIACATCHGLAMGGDDGQVRSPGIDGRPLDFNTPTIFNVAISFRLNWRGNFRGLEEQNESVLLNPRIMNTTWPALLAKLQGDGAYSKSFVAAYGGAPAAGNMLDALAAFQRSLLTPNSRFDRRLRGDHNAISPEEERGYQLFKSYGCVACHQGVNLGGNLFQRFGVFYDPFAQRKSATEADLGRFSVTGVEADKHVFRVPSLRNVAITAPYFHNGEISSLVEAVEIMARSQLGKELPAEDIDRIVQFLHTLTGEYQGRSLADADHGRQ